jgi:hypothetical protein
LSIIVAVCDMSRFVQNQSHYLGPTDLIMGTLSVIS